MPPRAKNNQWKSIATMLCLGGGLAVAAGVTYLLFTPKTYEASVKIRMRSWTRSAGVATAPGAAEISAQCRMIRSDEILDQAIKELGLNELWGKRFNQGAPLKTDQARLLLRARMDALPAPKSSIIQILVKSADREEAAKIANELAQIYCNKEPTQQGTNEDGLTQVKKKWDEQDQRIREARAALEKLYLDITRNRTTNPAAMHDVILARQIEIQGQYAAQRDELARLKTMTPEQLRQVLPSLETNSLLTTSMVQRAQAQAELVAAKSSYGADAPEVNHATLVLAEIDKTIDRTIAGIMTGRENEVVSLQAALDKANERLKSASSNLNEIAEQNAAYAQARQNLSNLLTERDELQVQMADDQVHDKSVPVLVPEIIDPAEPPSKPTTPDLRVGAAVIAAGIVAALAGVFLLAPRKPKPPRTL